MALSPTLLDRDHAVILRRPNESQTVFRGRYDPVMAEWVLFHPDPEVSPLTINHNQVTRLGDWDEKIDPHRFAEMRGVFAPVVKMSWSQYAAHQWGMVLRQRELVDRLKALEVDRLDRRHAPYGWDQGTPVGLMFYSLHLNNDELDALLTIAEERRSGRADVAPTD